MGKSFGTMVSGEEALNILDQIFPMIVFKNKKEEKGSQNHKRESK